MNASESSVADATEKSNRSAIRDLLKKQRDVNAPQADGMTALHWAAYHDDLETVQVLVDSKANVDVANRYGVTPLSIACQNGSAPIVELLLERGADPRTTLRGGETVLMTAARTGKPGPVDALIKRGADVNAKERRGQTALMWAAADGHTGVVELLIKAGADVRAKSPDSGFNAFFFAVREGRTDVVRALLKAGVDVNEAMEPLKPSGKSPSKGTSALILAVENGHFDLAVTLLEAGADPNDQRSGYTALHVMTWVRKPNRGEDDGAPPPLGSGNLSNLQFIRKLVEHGADVNARLKNGKGGPGLYSKAGATPFLMAAATADVVLMRLLVELGADPSLTNIDSCTPLMVVCGIGVGSAAANEVAGEEPEVLEAAQLLLELGADVNAVDKNGETAMHGAAYKNLPKVVQFLTDHGAKVALWNQKNKYGWTPLLIAEGHRPGNFKPSAETITALHRVMPADGVAPSVYGSKPAPGNTSYSTDEAKKTGSPTVKRDIEYARADGRSLKLDLYVPDSKARPPLIVWVHGGAWRSGSKADMPLDALVARGYAIASVDYRLSTEAKFPAQIHDIKAAIRFLRAHCNEWNLSGDRIIVAGNSAGGHLAALVGVSNRNADLEGKTGDDLDRSSSVQGAISFYGASDLTTILSQSTPHGLSVRVPALDLLLGGQPKDCLALARLASPVFHVDPSDPPLLLLHGDRDPQMPIDQSYQLRAACEKANAPVQFVVVTGAVHGGGEFYDEERLAIVEKFLNGSDESRAQNVLQKAP